MDSAAPVVFRLSPLQKIVWSKPELRGGFVYARAGVEGPLDTDRLRAAFEKVAERHESLRTQFQVSPGFTFPFQVVRERPEFSFDVHAAAANANDVLAAGAWPAATPFEGPVFSVKLIGGDGKYVLGLRALALCCDAASLANIVAEAAALYAEQSPEEAVQYADFSEWHNEALTGGGEEADAAKALWPEEAAVQALPLAGRFAGVRGETKRIVVKLDAAALEAEGAEAFLLGCWQALLWRLTGGDAVTVDVVGRGRPLDELAVSIGLFERPFPVTAGFADGVDFVRVRAQAAEGLAQVEQLQAYCTAETSGAVGFAYRALPAKTIAGDVTFAVSELHGLRWPFALSLDVTAGTGVEIVYDSAQYAEKDVARLARYFERTVRAAAGDAKVADYELMEDAERVLVVEAFNAETAEWGDARTFAEVFAAQAALTPERVALVFEKSAYTYAELNAKANQIASWLKKNGVGAGAAVGLCMERSAEMIVALLGIVKAGGAYVALLPDLPTTRLEHQIAEAGIAIVVTMETLLESLRGFGGKALCLDRDAAALESESKENPAASAQGDDAMYILYTSGSTGTPKGVRVRHRNVMNYVRGIAQRLGIEIAAKGEALNFATVSTLGADLGNTSIFPALLTGGTLTVIGYDAAIDGELFAEQHRARPIDVLKIAPSNLNALMAAGAGDVLPRKWLVTGGEACTWELAARVRADGTCRHMNHYGPTEATVGCLTYDVSAALAADGAAKAGVVPIGKPLANVQVYVLDAERRAVPVGVAGEICIAGAGIAGGYVGRPEETKARFVANAFGAGEMYRSGDVGRWLEDGSIEFLGRVDDQVKVRGHRVELAEVENVIGQREGVQQAVVLLNADSPGSTVGDSLSAYLVANAALDIAGLQVFVRERLPEYMLPREFVLLDELPLNANGKVDKKKLTGLKSGAAAAQSAVIAPRTELETQIAAIWSETLKREPIGVKDNFFDLGGHSLLATQIISRIRSGLGMNVSIRMLFEAPTVEQLAAAIETTRGTTGADAEMGDLLSELEGLSDAEAEAMLSGGTEQEK